MSLGRALLLSPGWLIYERPGKLVAAHLWERLSCTLSGVLADQGRALFEGGVNDSARASLAAAIGELSHLSPPLAPFAEALRTSKPTPVTPRTLVLGERSGMMFIELTAQCNERCVHCYAESAPERTEQLSLEEVHQALQVAVESGFRCVQFTGGDPLLSAELVPAVAAASALGLEIEIYTNGLALSDRLLDELAPYGCHFALSIYARSPAVHDSLTRVAGSHARTTRALKRLLETDTPVRVGVALTEANQESLTDTLAWLSELGLTPEQINVDRVRAVGRGENLVQLRVAKESTGASSPTPQRAQTALQPDRDSSEMSATSFWGRLTALPSGEACGCILDRTPIVGGWANIRVSLADTTPLLVDWAEVVSRMDTLSQELTCWPCRFRKSTLGAAS